MLTTYYCNKRWQVSVAEIEIAQGRNRNLQTSKAPLKSQAQGTSLFMSTVLNQRNSPEEVQVQLYSSIHNS